MLGLGCMRLSTVRDRDDERGVAVIRAALDAGITFFDTARSYGHDDADRGHNERLIARALASWNGDRSTITVATKGGMRRPRGEWVPDGRAKQLREDCAASREALGRDVIDLYQLHVVDPKTPIGTSVRALAKLRDEGWVRDVGLCNVTVSQIIEAQSIVPVASVQVSLGPLDDDNLRNGVAEYCRDNGIRLIAHRPLGGDRRKAITRDITLRAIADHHGASAEEVALAWLLSFGEGVVPLPGATRVESVLSMSRARDIHLSDADHDALDQRFAGNLLRVSRSKRRAKVREEEDVVVVMGMPGAGKTTIARELEAAGYERLNRDEAGGSLADLVPRLAETLRDGRRKVVLDNTYPSRASRNAVIETAWAEGVAARCIWLTTPIGDAQINAIVRMIEVHAALPSPEEIKARSRKDTRYMLPDGQFRYERTLEPPTTDEGFEIIECRVPDLRREYGKHRALILDSDHVAGGPALVDAVRRHVDEGWLAFVHAWRPNVSRGEADATQVANEVATLARSLGEAVDWAVCPHDAGPPVCWCRKPIPGQVIEFAMRRGIALDQSIVLGSSTADRTMAERIGARFTAALS